MTSMRFSKVAAIGATCLLAACTVTVEQSSLLPSLPEPVAESAKLSPGYAREDRMMALPDLGIVHVARLTRPGNRRTIVYSGGNGAFVATSMTHLDDLAVLADADIVAFDYPGRGGTTVPKTIDALIAFGPALMAGLRREGWIAPGPVYAYGFSLGGATAANIAASGGFAGLILEATAADIPAVVRTMLPGVVRPFVRVRVSAELARYDFVRSAARADCPILVIAGSADVTVRPATSRSFARDLQATGAKATLVEVPGGHGDALSTAPARQAVRRFAIAGSGDM